MSHLAVGDSPLMLIPPIVFTGLVIVSWALRSPCASITQCKYSHLANRCSQTLA
jgi:hypothetical protein